MANNTHAPKRFEARVLCRRCDHVINHRERFDSGGVCPYCGNVSGSSVVDTRTVSVEVGASAPASRPAPPEPPTERLPPRGRGKSKLGYWTGLVKEAFKK